MKNTHKILAVLCLAMFMGCGGSSEEKNGEPIRLKNHQTTGTKATKTKGAKASQWVDLANKGIGPVKSIDLEDEIDHTMAERGAEVYKKMCMACHRPDKKFIGPPGKGVLKRRTPEWVMNMLLNPDEMLKKDPIAKALLIEFYNAPMVDQNLTHDEARAVLEYYRTLD